MEVAFTEWNSNLTERIGTGLTHDRSHFVLHRYHTPNFTVNPTTTTCVVWLTLYLYQDQQNVKKSHRQFDIIFGLLFLLRFLECTQNPVSQHGLSVPSLGNSVAIRRNLPLDVCSFFRVSSFVKNCIIVLELSRVQTYLLLVKQFVTVFT